MSRFYRSSVMTRRHLLQPPSVVMSTLQRILWSYVTLDPLGLKCVPTLLSRTSCHCCHGLGVPSSWRSRLNMLCLTTLLSTTVVSQHPCCPPSKCMHASSTCILEKAEPCSTETPSQPSLIALWAHCLYVILANVKNDTESEIIMKSVNLSWQLVWKVFLKVHFCQCMYIEILET